MWNVWNVAKIVKYYMFRTRPSQFNAAALTKSIILVAALAFNFLNWPFFSLTRSKSTFFLRIFNSSKIIFFLSIIAKLFFDNWRHAARGIFFSFYLRDSETVHVSLLVPSFPSAPPPFSSTVTRVSLGFATLAVFPNRFNVLLAKTTEKHFAYVCLFGGKSVRTFSPPFLSQNSMYEGPWRIGANDDNVV